MEMRSVPIHQASPQKFELAKLLFISWYAKFLGPNLCLIFLYSKQIYCGMDYDEVPAKFCSPVCLQFNKYAAPFGGL